MLSPPIATPQAAHHEYGAVEALVRDWFWCLTAAHTPAFLLLGALGKGQVPQQRGWEKPELPLNDTRL